MKIRTFTLMILAVVAVSLSAQKPEAVIKKTDTPPVLDGIVEDVWEMADQYDIDQVFTGDAQAPTLGDPGTTWWKMLWDDAGIYVVLNVNDDVFWPNWKEDASLDSWMFDKPEIYFDINYILEDGLGTTDGGANGHYQYAQAITEANMDGTVGPIDDHSAGEASILVSDPTYVAEWFIPWDYMTDKEGLAMDPTRPVGFDVTIIDHDPSHAIDERTRAVWSNVGNIDQAWGNMDDCGIITFEGMEPPTLIESLELAGGAIEVNNGVLEIGVTITPEDAGNKNLKWSIVGLEPGGAPGVKISPDGKVTAVMDGTYTIKGETTDGSYLEDECEITVSGQLVSRHEINLIRNGYFQELDANGAPEEWNISGMASDPVVVDGVLYVEPTDGADLWSNRVQQTSGWNLSNNVEDTYTLSFGLWTDETDTINVDFEDAREAVGWNRYGTSSHELSNGNVIEWQWMSETEKSAASKYVFDCTFEELIYDESVEEFQFMLGHADGVVMIDSVELFLDADLEKITEGVVEVESIDVSGADGATTVHAGATLQMSAAVLPAEASYTDVMWMVEPGTGGATIDEAGLLTGDSAGTVMVKAMATDDSQVYGMLEVTVLFPASIEDKFVNTLKVYPNPAVNELYVELAVPNSIVTVYNSVGAKMDEVLVSGTQHRLDISHYGSGIYFVKTGELVAKFIK